MADHATPNQRVGGSGVASEHRDGLIERSSCTVSWTIGRHIHCRHLKITTLAARPHHLATRRRGSVGAAACEPAAPPMPYCFSNRGSMTSGGRDEHTHPHGRAERSTPRPARPGPGSVTTRAAASRQVAQQRRGYAAAVLRALARHERGRTTAQIQRTLRDSLTPLRLRLSPVGSKSWPRRVTCRDR
jgi:hypothetical protein